MNKSTWLWVVCLVVLNAIALKGGSLSNLVDILQFKGAGFYVIAMFYLGFRAFLSIASEEIRREVKVIHATYFGLAIAAGYFAELIFAPLSWVVMVITINVAIYVYRKYPLK